MEGFRAELRFPTAALGDEDLRECLIDDEGMNLQDRHETAFKILRDKKFDADKFPLAEVDSAASDSLELFRLSTEGDGKIFVIRDSQSLGLDHIAEVIRSKGWAYDCFNYDTEGYSRDDAPCLTFFRKDVCHDAKSKPVVVPIHWPGNTLVVDAKRLQGMVTSEASGDWIRSNTPALLYFDHPLVQSA